MRLDLVCGSKPRKNFVVLVSALPLGKVKSAFEPRRPIRPALISGFCSMKRLGVFLLPPGWDASPSQGYPQH